jgi:hypothetical protein
MLFNLARNCENLFEVVDHPGFSHQGEVPHELQHQIRPRLAGVLCVACDELRTDDVQDIVRG